MAQLRRSGFISYAHADAPLVDRFRDLLLPRCANLRELELDVWSDERILAGEPWGEEIATALAAADFGLVCVTPRLLASRYVVDVELPALLRGVTVVPLALEPIDFARADLRGLAHLQVFRLRRRGSAARQAFSECAGANRERFCDALVGEIADRLLAARRS